MEGRVEPPGTAEGKLTSPDDSSWIMLFISPTCSNGLTGPVDFLFKLTLSWLSTGL